MRNPATESSSSGRWEPLRCPVRPRRDELWVAPAGELDIDSAGVLRDVLAEYVGTGFARLVLDLRDLTFIDSTGLRTLLDARRSAQACDVELALIPGPPGIQRIFEITGTEGLFPLRPR